MGQGGRLVSLPFCESPVGPLWASTFSEILSLSVHGFVCERALTLDRTPYVAPPAPKSDAPPFAARMPDSAEAGLGAGQLPRARRGDISGRPVEAQVSVDLERTARPAGVVRAKLALRSMLPEIDWTVERLDRIAARNGARSGTLAIPENAESSLARLVKPGSRKFGSTDSRKAYGAPPQPSPFRTIAVMPRGPSVP
jgi:hypothetical protein